MKEIKEDFLHFDELTNYPVYSFHPLYPREFLSFYE